MPMPMFTLASVVLVAAAVAIGWACAIYHDKFSFSQHQSSERIDYIITLLFVWCYTGGGGGGGGCACSAVRRTSRKGFCFSFWWINKFLLLPSHHRNGGEFWWGRRAALVIGASGAAAAPLGRHEPRWINVAQHHKRPGIGLFVRLPPHTVQSPNGWISAAW